ncbi:MAG: Crp/Fnr family transcriptional regulator [Nitrospirae bacterium]|nr:Crp/Fnr family transcriptional regulator [Nitrospirota bacterium]MBF0534005.1 Crp/Fnr family transcriptional regulator [Nitrospirota bacterium]MBF0616164.1 Crp/Fnr family transcriptional regulator [Nitrospirota bacterium]
MEFKDIFEKFDIFNGLDETEKKLITGLFKRTSFKQDEEIYKEGEDGGTLYFLTNGKVRICKMSTEGDILPYAVVKAGETFGLMSFVDGSKHSAIALADKDCEVVKVDKRDVEELMEHDPKMAAKVYKVIAIHLSEIIRSMNNQYMDLTTYMFRKG